MTALLLALDPGLSTGYSIWSYDAETPLTHVEHGTIPGGVRGVKAWWRSREHTWEAVVCESFRLGDDTEKPEVDPLRTEGLLIGLWDGLLVFQSRDRKVAVPDRTLKRLGFWWKGKGHDRDSARHAIIFMRAVEHRPTIEAFWPDKRGVVNGH